MGLYREYVVVIQNKLSQDHRHERSLKAYLNPLQSTAINTRIKRLAKRKQRQYNRAKQSGKEKDWSHFKALKKRQNKKCRKAHNNYVASIVAPELESKPRKFWSYIKSKKCESFGVSPPRAGDGIGSSNTPDMTPIKVDNVCAQNT